MLASRDGSAVGRIRRAPARDRIVAAQGRPSLWSSYLQVSRGARASGARGVLERDPALPTDGRCRRPGCPARRLPRDADAALVSERLVDLDEGIQEWRYRHVKMVERTIGTKRGTGGSAGVEYLRPPFFHPVFPDLWEIRSRL